jgi:sugar/nucleoside kinase (ribokinase family)
MKKYDIICVGIANFSVYIKPVDKTLFDADVTLIDPVDISTGGDAMNESLTAARLGNKVALVSKIGDDLFGRYLLEQASDAGVSIEHIVISKATKTAFAAMLVDGLGDRRICTNRGAFETLCIDDIDLALFERTKIVSVGSMFALKNLDGEGVRKILEKARNAGAITCSDVKFDTYRLGFEGIKPAFPFLDYFLPNYDEALYLTREKDPARQCQVLMGAGCGNVIVKLGKDGCFLASNGTFKFIPPCPTICVDTSGAGDNFVAGFLTGLNKGWGAEESARFGNATAAVSIQEVGSNGVIRSYEQVTEHMRTVNY